MVEISLILGTLAITYAFVQSDGAWGVMYKIRNIKAVKDFGIFECITCTSFWVSVILCMSFYRPDMILIAWGAIVLIDTLLKAHVIK